MSGSPKVKGDRQNDQEAAAENKAAAILKQLHSLEQFELHNTIRFERKVKAGQAGQVCCLHEWPFLTLICFVPT